MSKPKLTGWYAPEQKPERVGWYEAWRFRAERGRVYWDGLKWRYGPLVTWDNWCGDDKWRGLARAPRGGE